MGQKVNPKAFRLTNLTTWASQWFHKKNYQRFLKEDAELREHILNKLKDGAVEKVIIERSPNLVNITIHTARPGIVIGKGGAGIEELKQKIQKKVKTPIRLDIQEIRNPDACAVIVAQGAAEQIERRMPFRRVLKQIIDRVYNNKEVEGVKISIAGRLGGVEMSRTEWLSKGKIPLQTIRANIDFGKAEAHTKYGVIGIKVWIYLGEVFETGGEKIGGSNRMD